MGLTNLCIVIFSISLTTVIYLTVHPHVKEAPTVSPSHHRPYTGYETPADNARLVAVNSNVTFIYHEAPAGSDTDKLKLALLFHSCRHSMYNFFETSAHCAACIPMPEELRLTKGLLSQGYSVMAPQSTSKRCWKSYISQIGSDYDILRTALNHIKETIIKPGKDNPSLAMVGVGISSGGRFLSTISGLKAIHIIVASSLHLSETVTERPSIPAHSFTHMAEQDRGLASTISDNMLALRLKGVPALMFSAKKKIINHPNYWHDAFPQWKRSQCQHMARLFDDSRIVDQHGYLRKDPRKEDGGDVWRKVLAKWSWQQFSDDLNDSTSAIAEEVNRAWALHEATADYFDEVLEFFHQVVDHDEVSTLIRI